MRILSVMVITVITFYIALGCKQKASPPNVLFIAIDDLRPELGCYGNPIAQTPTLDNLAKEGVIFQNHFVQVPTCGASRYSLLTGMRPSKPVHLSNKAIEVEISDKSENAFPETFIHHLKRNGYYTVGIGKISHSAEGLVYGYHENPSNKRELPHSWNELVFDSGKWGTGWNSFFGYSNGQNRQSLEKKVKPYEAGDVDDEGYVDGLTTNLTIAKLRELKERKEPFFLGVGFFKPHLPFNAPKRYWDLYKRDEIPLSPNASIPENINTKSLHDSDEFNQYKLTDEIASLSKPVSDDYAKKIKHAYLAGVSYIDAQVGKVLNELRSLGLDKNTIVVVWGDHGWHLGDQRLWGKHTLFDNALKSVLIIKTPRNSLNKKSINSIIETVDIYPSILELCEIELPYRTDGESFVDLLKDTNSKTHNVAYSYFKNGISLRTDKYRLTQYFREAEPTLELYDHENDPNETKNIAHSKPELVKELMPLMTLGDTGLYQRN